MIDEDPPHHHRGHANELGAVLPVVHLPLVDQPEIRLVHERGGLQGVVEPLAG